MQNIQVRVAVAGVNGRMGKQLIRAILQMNCVTLGAAIEHDPILLGIDAGELVGIKRTGVMIQNNLAAVKDDFDVFIDFTYPKSTLEHLAFCRQFGKKMVIGTTGFDEIGKTIIKDASKEIAIIFSANFSVGINVMIKLLEKATKIIGSYTDIEIIEAHHRYKSDVPSGTALTLGEAIAKTMNKDFKKCAIYMNENHASKRIPGTIGFSSLRAGDIIGEHTVIFADIGERIEITHKSTNRMNFANGALKSALWLKSKTNGLFNMQDVLGLHDLEV